MTDKKQPGTNPDNQQVVTPLHATQNSAQGSAADETTKQAWFRRFWPLLLSMSLSILWVGACVWWFMESGKTLSRMPIYEAGGLLAGASLPLILIWLVALVYLRTDPLRDHRMALTHGLDGLLAPLEVAQRRVNAIVADLHKEISHVEAAGDIATTRIDNLEKRFQDQISNLFEVTTDAEAKATNLQNILSSERESFSGLVADITEHVTEMENLFKQIKFDSESITNTTRMNSEKVSNEITFQNKTLTERTKLIEDQLEKMALNLVTMSQGIAENCDASDQKIGQMAENLAEKQTNLTKNFTELSNNSDQVCEKISQQSAMISDLNKKTSEESENISRLLTDQTSKLSAAADEAFAQTNKSSENFQTQANAIHQKLNDATHNLDAKSETLQHTISARISAMESALEQQAEIIRQQLIEQAENLQQNLDQNAHKSQEFITQQGGDLTENITQRFSDMIAQMETQTAQLKQFAEDTTGQLEGTVNSIEGQANRVDEAVKLTSESLSQQTSLMDGHYKSFEELSEKFRNQITDSETHLKAQHDDIFKSLSGVTDHLETSLQNLKDQSSSLGSHAQDIISSIVTQTDQLSVHIDDIRSRTENTIQNIHEMGETVSDHFTATDSQAAELSENWLKTAKLVENQCSDTLSKLDNLTTALTTLEKENIQATEKAESNSAKVADQMQIASENIYLASSSAMEAADETNRAIEQHAEKFQQFINAIQLSNKSILIDAEAIEKKFREKNGNHFSTIASKIIEQLQSLSIDINRYFEDDVPDKVWQSYVEGDKNTFVRRLKKLTNKKYADSIGEKYKADPEFRKHAIEYMQIFEDLMSQSMASGNYSIFSVALISSETGKVYLALAQATNRF